MEEPGESSPSPSPFPGVTFQNDGNDDLSFAYLADLPATTRHTQDSFAWEQIRANWTRRPEGGQKIEGTQAGRNTAQKLVLGGTISQPVKLEDVISCLLVKWEEESEDQ